jgi:hypothetical protein
MAKLTSIHDTRNSGMVRRGWMPTFVQCLAVLIAITTAICHAASAAPVVGDTYVYRVVNGYNQETIGYLRHEITSASLPQGQIVSVTPDTPGLGLPRTEIYAADGNWLRHPLDSHGLATDYEFAPALPITPPLAAGEWSVRVNAMVPGHSTRRSVRIDGKVLGNEHVRVSAGEFDAVKVRRIIYPGDMGDFRTETRIVELAWYVPALGRSVRSETRSSWEVSCLRGPCKYYGDWQIVELTEFHAVSRQ